MIPLIKSTFFEEEKTKKELAIFVLKAKRLSFDKECIKFEKKFSDWQGRRHCIFVNSGSSANLALIQALINLRKLRKGDNVGFSSVTWSTNVMPLLELGLKPVPVDIELNTLNISSSTLLEVLKRRKLKALFVTNLLGFCGDLDEIVKICKKEKIILIEDNCESLGSVYKGKKLGNFGLASTFSFYVGHHMSTVEGGMVCTNDAELSTMLKLVHAHGWDRNLDFNRRKSLMKKYRINSQFYSRYTFYDLGYNLRPTEINGFLGNIQLKYLNRINKLRENNFKRLSGKLYTNSNYISTDSSHIDFVSNFAVPIVCKNTKVKDDLVEKCKGRVEIRPMVGGDITKQPFFKKHSVKGFSYCKNAQFVHKNGLYFGNNPELTEKDLGVLEGIFV